MAFFKRFYNSFFHVCHRQDISRYDVEPKSNLPIYGVYHVLLETGWQSLVSSQIKCLKDSGLLDASKKFFVSCIAEDEADVEQLKRLIDSDKMEMIFLGSDPKKYEYPALEYIKELSEKEDCLIYYFHSKGISYQSVNKHDHVFLSFKHKIEAWTDMLQYFIFDKWHVAVNVLLSGYDTYGCYLWPPEKPTMYSGNFWWARSEYIRKLPDFNADVISANRFYSETWLFTLNHSTFSAFDTVSDLYYVYMPHSIDDGSANVFVFIKFVLTYNWRKFEKHVFHYSYKKHCQERFQNLRMN